MALELYMIGLVTRDMGKSLEFYRRLGLAIPEGSEEMTHVEVKMGNGLTFFLDSKPSRWDPGFVKQNDTEQMEAAESYPFLLEFYLKSLAAVDAKYTELTGFGYRSRRAPYKTLLACTLPWSMILMEIPSCSLAIWKSTGLRKKDKDHPSSCQACSFGFNA